MFSASLAYLVRFYGKGKALQKWQFKPQILDLGEREP
jgi:hypothetical protein